MWMAKINATLCVCVVLWSKKMKKDKFCTTNNGSLANNACVCVLSVMLCLAKIGSYCLTFVNAAHIHTYSYR